MHIFPLRTPRLFNDIHLVSARANLIYRDLVIIQRYAGARKNGGGEEAKEEHRVASRPFLSGLDSGNQHKSRRFIICVGRHVEDTIG